MMLAGQSFGLGIIADLLAANRKLIQETRQRVRALQFADRVDAHGESRSEHPR